ncbi:MAG: hypothetical protein LBF63_11615, partial [Treponema sp.]|jgi:uncharacterized coiled-coil DUF342 family protein|nr:hypothetical protein [Treponema sp.]
VVLAQCSHLGDGAGEVSPVLLEAAEKSRSLRRRIAELEGRIEKIMVEWEELKKNEVDLRELEDQSRGYGRQE